MKWKDYADAYSRDPVIQWPALLRIAEEQAVTVIKSRRAYWRAKARHLAAEVARLPVGKTVMKL